jgi:hypothetical protein
MAQRDQGDSREATPADEADESDAGGGPSTSGRAAGGAAVARRTPLRGAGKRPRGAGSAEPEPGLNGFAGGGGALGHAPSRGGLLGPSPRDAGPLGEQPGGGQWGAWDPGLGGGGTGEGGLAEAAGRGGAGGPLLSSLAGPLGLLGGEGLGLEGGLLGEPSSGLGRHAELLAREVRRGRRGREARVLGFRLG